MDFIRKASECGNGNQNGKQKEIKGNAQGESTGKLKEK